MLVYTVTNLKTKKVYVGTTASTAEGKWANLIEAAERGFDFPLYEEIREMGQDNFLIEEWADGLTREETQTLELEAIATFHGESIKGYKLLPRMPSKRKKAKTKNTPETPPPEIETLEEDCDLDLSPLSDEFSQSENDENFSTDSEDSSIEKTAKTVSKPPSPSSQSY